MDDDVSLVADPVAASPAAADPAPAADPASATPAAPAAAAPAVDPAKPAADPAKPADPPKPAEAKGAPDAYEPFKVPDGFEVDQALLGEFSPTLKELNLSQDDAQKVMDFAPKFASAVAEKTTAAVLDAVGLAGRDQWAAQVKADKELGGEKVGENVAIARQGLEAYGTPALKALLVKTGLANHPEVVRVFNRMGREVKPDGFVPGGATRTPTNRYPNSNMNP